ncbi:MAG: TetR/AcrR family transcriptional regulator [Kineosporiaceae bacterium]|nr:TetR/AcrR family transcriptional regulator [Kineosporiaceae bacterium]
MGEQVHAPVTAYPAQAGGETGATPAGLRERKKALAMRRIQQVAIELFERDGFAAVSVEQVAEAAEVSPSSVYRYFGTKEGLVVHDEHDAVLLALAPSLLAEHDLVTAFDLGLRLIGAEHGIDLERTRRRTRLWFTVPSIRAAGLLMADEMTDALAHLASSGPRADHTFSQARVVVGSLVGAVMAALHQWYDDGMPEDMVDRMLEAVATVRQAMSRPTGPPQ